MKKNELNFRTLKPEEIQVRVGNINSAGARYMLYADARTVMDILDETVGPMGWQSDHKELKGVIYGGVAIRDDSGNWVWKWDCGTESNSEPAKGECSDALKRAGVRWGITRELYSTPDVFIPCKTVQKGDKWYLADDIKWHFTNNLYVREIEYDENRNISKLVIVADYWDKNKKRQVVDTVFTYPRNASYSNSNVNNANVNNSNMPSDFPAATTITKGSLQYLQELIKNTGANEAEICSYYKVRTLAEMTTDSYSHLVKILEGRLPQSA